MISEAITVAEYLASLPADRREAIAAVRKVILENLDKEYEETMQYGMISYAVSAGAFPADFPYDPKHPLPFAALASQKDYMSVYLMGVYSDDGNEHADWFRKSWAKAGKKLDMGKCCVRFTKLDDVALDVLGEAIRRIPAKRYVEIHAQAISHLGKDSSGSADAAPATPEPAAVTAKPPSKQSAKPHSKPASKQSAKQSAKQHGAPSKQSAKQAAKQHGAPSKQSAKQAAKKPAKKTAAHKHAAKRR
ncbi:MAG TPA: DUF1801 domain-containing protein [Planctomycetota bacterium]|nr:DUF1801 domain-containing protein [Planctomycetota bacterium]